MKRNIEVNGRISKWSKRIGLILSIIALTTFANQIHSKYFISKNSISNIRLEDVCKKVEALEDKIENIEKQITEMNLKRETSLAEIKGQLILIIKKIDKLD